MLLVEKQFVILVYENSISVMNAQTGDILQDFSPEKFDNYNQGMKFKFKYAAINIENKNVFVVSHGDNKKASCQSQVIMLREQPYEQQIMYLMGCARIDEAREIFNAKSNKSTEQYGERLKRFEMDAAWQLLKIKLDYQKFVLYIQNTDVDPRELIILFKDLYETSHALKKQT